MFLSVSAYIYILNYICGDISVGQKLKQAWLGSLFRVYKPASRWSSAIVFQSLTFEGFGSHDISPSLAQGLCCLWGCSRCGLVSVVRHLLGFLESMLGTMLVHLSTVTVLNRFSSVVLFWVISWEPRTFMVFFPWVLKTTNDRLALLPIIFWERHHNSPTPIFGHEGKGLIGRMKLIQGYCQDP